MSNLTLGATAITFPVLNPGQRSLPQTLAITPEGDPFVVTMSIVNPPSGAFDAQMFVTHSPGRDGLIVKTQLATTVGVASAASATLTAVAATAISASYYSVEVNFTAPDAQSSSDAAGTPVPNTFSGTLTLSWQGGSASVQLTATTASLMAGVNTTEPIGLTPGKSVGVPIKLVYLTLDPTSIEVDLASAPGEAPPSGLTIGDANTTLGPTYVQSGGNPKGGSQIPREILQTQRTAIVTPLASSAVDLEPGLQTAYISVATPEFPQLNPVPVKVTFKVAALPVQVRPPIHKIYMLPGTPVSLQLTISAAGAQTNLEIGPMSASYQSNIPTGAAMSGSAPVTIAWPQSEGPTSSGKTTLEIGDGSSNFAFELTANSAAFANSGAVIEISLPWTAYNGLLSGTATFEISVLPNNIQFKNSTNYAQLSGSYKWTLNSSGYSYFQGNVTVPWSEVLDQDYAVGVALSCTNPQGNHLAVGHQGTLGGAVGTVFGDDSDSWADAGRWNDPNGWINSSDPNTILSAWAEICSATATESSSYSPDALDAVLGFLLGITVVEGVVAGVVYFIKNLQCTTSGGAGAGDDDEGDGDGGDADVELSCSVN